MGYLLYVPLFGATAMLVILYFMHVRWSSRLTWVFASSGFLFLVILLVFTLSDQALFALGGTLAVAIGIALPFRWVRLGPYRLCEARS